MNVKVAGVQLSCVDDPVENVDKAVKLSALAVESGARVVCLQPLFNVLWFPRSMDDRNFALAETEDGPTLTRMREEAARLGCCLILPLFEREGDHCFFTAFVVGHDGALLGKYRKAHLPDIPLWREKYYFAPGDTGYPVFQYEGLSFGVQICWDNFFPEGARSLALDGASVIFAPTAAAFMSYGRWETVLSATAMVNGVYVMRVNRVGHEAEQDFYGRSFCVNPEGDFVIGPIGLNDGILLSEIDTGKISRVRAEWNFMSDRRPETYGAIARLP